MRIIRNTFPGQKAVKLYDGRGMFLLVTPTGSKWWRLKYQYQGREKQISLGVYPAVTLSAARKRRDRYRALLAKGIDPSERIKAEKAERLAGEARQRTDSRFALDSDGTLHLRLGKRHLALNPTETEELRSFLIATRDVGSAR